MDDIIEVEKNRTILISEDTVSDIIELPSNSLIISETVSSDIIYVNSVSEILTSQYQSIPKSGLGAGGAIFVSNVTPTNSGIVSSKEWQEDTIPSESYIRSCVTDTDLVRISIYIEGNGSNFTPSVTIDNIPVLNLVQHSSNARIYEGYVDTTVVESRDILIKTSLGLSDSVFIERASAGSEVISIILGDYPNNQTELKQGDIIPIIINTDVTASKVTIYNYGASGQSTELNVINGKALGNLTVSNKSGSQFVKVVATNDFGTSGSDFISNDSVLLNQTYPTILSPTLNYPTSQSALKNNESVIVNSIVTDFDTINYSVSDDLIITESKTQYSSNKTVTRMSGDYVVDSYNYSIIAVRSANNAVSQMNTMVKIVNIEPTGSISIDGSPTSLKSNNNGVDYIIRLSSSQNINIVPKMDADLGLFNGVFTVSSNSYIKTITINDTVPKGIGTFNNLILVGLSGIVGNVITNGSSYNVAGFDWRTITFNPFAQLMPIGTNIYNFNNTEVKLTGTSDLFVRKSDTLFDLTGFTITDNSGIFNINSNNLFINNSNLTNSNASGALKFDIREKI